MSDASLESPQPKQSPGVRREEINRIFQEMAEQERRDRLEKTMRLRRMRLVKE
jgi:hypothetical protein